MLYRGATQLRVALRIICESVVIPVKVPVPIGAAENEKADYVRENLVQPAGGECGVVDHFVKAREVEGGDKAKKDFRRYEREPAVRLEAPRLRHRLRPASERMYHPAADTP